MSDPAPRGKHTNDTNTTPSARPQRSLPVTESYRRQHLNQKSTKRPADSHARTNPAAAPNGHRASSSSSKIAQEAKPLILSPEAQQYSRMNYGSSTKKKKPSALRKAGYAALGLFALLVISVGVSGALMASQLNDLRGQVSTLQHELFAGDPAVAQVAAADLSKTVHSINSQAKMPQWTIASLLPFIGNDFKTIITVADSADQLCSQVIVPLTTDMVAKGTGPLVVEGKRLNAPAIQTALETLSLNAANIHECSGQIHAISSALVPPLDKIRRAAHGAFDGVDTLASASAYLAPQIPWLLGADGAPRNYLLVALSNAEIRSIGGLPGSYGILTIDNGAMSTHDFLALKDTPRYVPTSEENVDTTTIAPGLTDEEYVLFGRRVVNVPAETAVNPQFPRFAESFSWLRTYRGHGETEGVVAIDPLLLQDLLGVTGAVTTGDGTVVSSDNVARLLLNEIYFTKAREEQDAFFAEVASLCFESLTANINADSAVGLLQALWHASNTRNLQAWFPNNELEMSMDVMGYSGTIPHDPMKPALGVYVSDDTWSKISWYMSLNTQIGKPVKNDDGTVSYSVTTAIKNNLTPNEAEALPRYVTGTNWRKRSPGDMLDWVFFCAPAGGTITDMKANAYFTPLDKTRYGFNGMLAAESMNEASYAGVNTWFGAIQIDAGEKAVFTYTVTTAPSPSAELALDQTPTAEKVAGW